jgi:molecular chaperone DnaK
MAEIFGIDFGTTNSVASVVLELSEAEAGQIAVLTNREDRRPHPSVIWYRGNETIVGRKAKDALGELVTGAAGDFVRSPKTLLGSTHGVHVGGTLRRPLDLAADVFTFLRRDALARGYEGEEFNRAVVSIPVAMPGRARRELRQAALKAGIRIHQFVHEPLAALYGHLKGEGDAEARIMSLEGQLVLVFDWGGGTLDLTLCRIADGAMVQVANLGDPHVGGDQFDRRLERLVRRRHEEVYPDADWDTFQPSGRARLIQACEDAKIALSEKESTHLFAPDVLTAKGPAAHIEVEITRSDLSEVTADLVRAGLRRIEEVLAKADATHQSVEFCLATGGTVSMPAIRDGLIGIFGPAHCRFADNAATVISEGCAWIARDGVGLTMAKSLSLLHAGDVFVPVIPEGTSLPVEGKTLHVPFALYCVDPRDGFAKFLLARSRWPGDLGEMIPYGQMAVSVDPGAKPLRERLHLSVSIDQDLVVSVAAKSEGTGFERQTEIHDLEFGLGVGVPQLGGRRKRRAAAVDGKLGDVRVKGNVTPDQQALNLVPGEIVREAFPLYDNYTELQRDERVYYQPCCKCQRQIFEIRRDGCALCAESDPELSPERAAERRRLFEEVTMPDTWTADGAAAPDETSSPVPDLAGDLPSKSAESVTGRRIEALGFSVRVTNCMKNNGVETLGDLISTSESSVAGWRSLGVAGLREIKSTLEGLGLKLK